MQRFQRLVDRRLIVEAVDLIEIDVVHTQPAQRGIDRQHNLLARQPAADGLVDRVKHFRGDDDLVARGEVLEGAARLPRSPREPCWRCRRS